MSRTLFFYIFKDLIRVFLLASGALAGIMSFGALLRPLTEHGLDGSQVAQMLSYLMPAMTTYSLPIAALFATTMVYGRLSADNEIVACRAAGISHLAIAVPALVMGLIVALVSLLFLCFVVPTFTYRVERVIYSNLARLVANEIERTHQIQFKNFTIFAEGARVPPPNPEAPNTQSVVLDGPMIVVYNEEETGDGISVPSTFFLARQTEVRMHRDPKTGSAILEGDLIDGRTLSRGRTVTEGGVAASQIPPQEMESPIQEETKFMDIRRLNAVLRQPGISRRLRDIVDELVRDDQELRYLRMVRDQLRASPHRATFETGHDRYELAAPSASMRTEGGKVILTSKTPEPGGVQLTRVQPDGTTTIAKVREIRLDAFALSRSDQMSINVELIEPVIQTGEQVTEKESFSQQVLVPMPPELLEFQQRTPLHYLEESKNVSPAARQRLLREWYKVTNGVMSELHGRASFAVSCLILVVVGCALGMMFKSGNFLSAFALSVVPALLSITLIATGQQTCENIPQNVTLDFHNPLNLGLALIWSGNLAVLAIAVTLMWRLQRQ